MIRSTGKRASLLKRRSWSRRQRKTPKEKKNANDSKSRERNSRSRELHPRPQNNKISDLHSLIMSMTRPTEV
jgi:hypothetical protein